MLSLEFIADVVATGVAADDLVMAYSKKSVRMGRSGSFRSNPNSNTTWVITPLRGWKWWEVVGSGGIT